MGAIDDLEEAIELARQIVNMTPINHPYLAARLNGLGNHLGDRYLKFGRIHDLEEAIRVGRQAVDMIKEGHPNRARYLRDLGDVLGHRYGRTGDMADLDESIHFTEKAVNMTSAYHPNHAMYLDNLGAQLHKRYQEIRAMSDLEEAIRLARQSVQTILYQADRSVRLYNLSCYLGDKYKRTMVMGDLEESIQVGRRAMDLTPKDHPTRTMMMNNLGAQLEKRYLRTIKLSDLEEAIELQKSVVRATSQEQPDRPGMLCNLGRRLERRYTETGEASDLEEAIRLRREALKACPEDDPAHAAISKDLGQGLIKTFRRTTLWVHLKEALLHLHNALHQVNAATITRIQAGHALLMACTITKDWQQAYEASETAIRLIPRLTSRSLENHDKHHMLRQIAGLASDAAAVALQVGKGASMALSLLEQGRGLLALSVEDTRTDLLSLHEKHPELADRFVSLRDQLELQSTQTTHHVVADALPPWGRQQNRRYDTGNELERIIAEIRRRPGFEDFLAIPNVEEMQAAAIAGPIVVINVGKFRCDALLVEKAQIRALPLPQLHHREIKKATGDNLGNPITLGWLWDVVVSPILNHLGFAEPPSSSTWPHVWWINTGPLTKFPIHAAGYHNKRSGETVLDRVMSSYSTSLKTLVHSRRRHSPQLISPAQAQALLVAMEHTPGYAHRLPFATKEIAMLHDLCKLMALDPVEPSPCKENIMSLLSKCKLFHFAGHGYADDQDPLQSYLLMGNEQQERLTVFNLLAINLRTSLPFLAYLSACGTGRIKDKRSVDEGIHLVSACQLAGFRHVIGTLWEVNDEICLDVARITYNVIREKGMTDSSVCWGLHRATTELRNRWVAESENTSRDKRSLARPNLFLNRPNLASMDINDGKQEGDGLSRDVVLLVDEEDEDGGGKIQAAPSWVAYVHFGI
jgi:tetratricopeptide (TPR) repeat protein